jgi:hypothetical protein
MECPTRNERELFDCQRLHWNVYGDALDRWTNEGGSPGWPCCVETDERPMLRSKRSAADSFIGVAELPA